VFGSIGRGLRISVTMGSWKVCMSASVRVDALDAR
jgi:hypothetical protein